MSASRSKLETIPAKQCHPPQGSPSRVIKYSLNLLLISLAISSMRPCLAKIPLQDSRSTKLVPTTRTQGRTSFARLVWASWMTLTTLWSCMWATYLSLMPSWPLTSGWTWRSWASNSWRMLIRRSSTYSYWTQCNFWSTCLRPSLPKISMI